MLNFRKGSCKMERTKIKLRPESNHYISDCITKTDVIEAFAKQETITGKVVDYDFNQKNLKIFLGNNIYATMEWQEATIYPFRYPRIAIANNVPREILSLIHKKVRVKVINIDSDHIYVSRKKNMIEIFEMIREETRENPEIVYSGRIVGKYKYGAFYDIGDGILAFCHISEYTSVYVRNFTSWVSIGEKAYLKLVKIDNDYKINCSRKQAAERTTVDLYNRYDVVLIKLSEPLYEKESITGYYAEVTPIISGIANNGEGRIYCPGDIVTAIVKRTDITKNQLNLIIIDN